MRRGATGAKNAETPHGASLIPPIARGVISVDGRGKGIEASPNRMAMRDGAGPIGRQTTPEEPHP